MTELCYCGDCPSCNQSGSQGHHSGFPCAGGCERTVDYPNMLCARCRAKCVDCDNRAEAGCDHCAKCLAEINLVAESVIHYWLQEGI